MGNKLSISLLAALLAGCASPVGVHRSALTEANNIQEVSNLAPKSLSVGETVRAELGPKDSVVLVEGGRSFGAMYKIDTSSGIRRIHILGDCHCGYAGTAYWLFPRITVFDANFNEISSGPTLALKNRVKTRRLSERLVLEGTLALPDNLSGRLYILVHTTPALTRKAVSMTKSSHQITVIGGTAIPSGTNTSSFVIPASPQGAYEITALSKDRQYPDDARHEDPPYGVIVDQNSD